MGAFLLLCIDAFRPCPAVCPQPLSHFPPTVSTSLQLLSLKPLITLLAIVNPLAILPFYISYTQDFNASQRLRTIRATTLTVFVVLTSCALLGLEILSFFNISLASFQVGGGMLLLISALQMINAQPAEARTNAEETTYAARQASIGVVPLGIPLLTGPATMSTMVIFANRSKNWLQMVQLIGYAVLVALAVYVSFLLAPRIARAMGQTGINVMTRLMGLILAAMGVEVMADGLRQIFPALGGS